jgi:hypothetical protein
MTARYLQVIAVGVLCLLSLQSHAQSTRPDATTSVGLQSVTIGERGTEQLHFDRPINHVRSWLSLIHDGWIVKQFAVHRVGKASGDSQCRRRPIPIDLGFAVSKI